MYIPWHFVLLLRPLTQKLLHWIVHVSIITAGRVYLSGNQGTKNWWGFWGRVSSGLPVPSLVIPNAYLLDVLSWDISFSFWPVVLFFNSFEKRTATHWKTTKTMNMFRFKHILRLQVEKSHLSDFGTPFLCKVLYIDNSLLWKDQKELNGTE